MYDLKILPTLYKLAKDEYYEEAALRLIFNFSFAHNHRLQYLFENKIYNFLLGFLNHPSQFLRGKMCRMISNITHTNINELLKETSLIEKLFKLLKTNELEVKK